MVMRWLTRDWHGSGENFLTDAEVDERTAAYKRHRQVVLPSLPADLQALAGEPISERFWVLHDGRVETWEAHLPERCVLVIVSWGKECGFHRLRIKYLDAELFGATEQQIARWLCDDRTQLLFQEVDVAPDGRFEHRHLLWPEGEFGVRFVDIGVDSMPATAADYDRAHNGE